jgi:phage major head subunit gpT-like protein
MLITKTAIQNLQVGFSTIFQGSFRETPTWSQNVATTVPSSTRTTTYGWMSRILAMRRWEGPRLIQNLNTQAYTLENKPFEATIGVDKHDIADDALGIYNVRFQELGRIGRKLPDQQVRLALQQGSTNTTFDGVAFFHSSHTLNPAGVQANTGAQALDPGVGQGWDIVRSTMVSYVGEDGEPLGVVPNLIIVPPQLETAAKRVVASERLANGASNVQNGEASVLVVPELSNEPDTWYAADTSAPIKPLIWQEREPVSLVAKINADDDNVFFNREFLWGLEGRGVAGYGPWWLIYKATGGASADLAPGYTGPFGFTGLAA